VKEDAPQLLRRELSSRSWQPATIAMSGVTDCYQPVERKLRITRQCLEVLAEFRNPVSVITKNHLVTRDIDILSDLATDNAASASLSVTTLDPELQRRMEPRTSSPAKRLEAIERLAAAGVPVGVMVAPVIPGLTDHELPAILRAVADAGARTAGFVILRLPFAVSSLFEDWLAAHYPDRAAKVVGLIRGLRGGKLYDSAYGSRMRGEGQYAEQIAALFHVTAAKLGLDRKREPLSTSAWRAPAPGASRGQLSLF
jgi:DNA repair photolyase